MLVKTRIFAPIITMVIVFLSIIVIFEIQKENFISQRQKNNKKVQTTKGVCPPFNLYDEEGKIIDPVHKINDTKPYSPKQTCGKCHDYMKITEGFHFQQGKGEKPTEIMSTRYQWTTSPGNYGGTWCSPAPIYRQLAKKRNTNAREIDMTSFDFVTATCGTCHPGGGPLEFDREGIRYDIRMNDTSNHLKSSAINNYDGDYFKARWNETGVLEADCMLCHLPEYDYKARNLQLEKLNFKWAATKGANLAEIEGSIKDTILIKVNYDISKFDSEGKLSLHLVREPRNETCLNCHAKPDWKKRGTTFSARRDVHIAAGLKCVDCHPAGSDAIDERVRGKEVHQFGKGDDPSGNVRNDLDNTVRDCKDCHLKGYLNAPLAKHSWLPPLHLEKIACQTCHINERPIKSALVQVSDIFNPGTKISPPPKYIWTFYDQNMNYWNHYGELNMFTAKDEPTDPSRPVLAKYKEKIYPVNPVHSAWPGILIEGKSGLDQPTMKDIYTMWISHQKDSLKYPLLSKIVDDNGDKIPEVNKSEEIDAFIKSVTLHLINTGYDMKGKKVVWVNNDRVYTDGNSYFILPKAEYESSPYASVYKYSHDVSPAKAAIGINGCTDCHSFKSPFFNAEIVKYPFGEDGKSITEPQYSRLGLSFLTVNIGALREEIIKPIIYSETGLLIVAFLIGLISSFLLRSDYLHSLKIDFKLFLVSLYIITIAILSFIYLKVDLNSFIFPNRLWLDANHFMISGIIIIAGFFVLYKQEQDIRNQKIKSTSTLILFILLIFTLISGFIILVKFEFLTRIAYNLYDILLSGILFIILIATLNYQIKNMKIDLFQEKQL